MYALKGFIPHSDFILNVPGEVSAIGELTQLSLSFSRNVGFYTDPANYPRISLVSFTSARDSVNIEVEAPIQAQTLKISKFVYDNTILHSGQVFADELLQKLTVTFDAEAEDFKCGAIVNEGQVWMPEWVSWKSKLLTVAGAPEENLIKVWFVDDNFQTHYDDYQILVVPPFDNLDDFFRTGQEVKLALESQSIKDTASRAQLAKLGIPESVFGVEAFNYIDPLNPANVVPSQWGLLIYGLAGNNIDSIKDALVDYILAHSTHSRDDWVKILPDLFRRTEFTMVPRWDLYSIPNRTSQTGIYSPQLKMTESLATLKTFVSTYTDEAHINEHASAMGFPYRSIHILTVGSPENRDLKFELADYFPDLINVSSTSPDFARMSQDTQTFALKLMQMILDAETLGPYDSPSTGFTKVTRNGQLFVVYSQGNVHYLVAAKFNFPATP